MTAGRTRAAPWLFLLPFGAVFVVFTLGPLAQSLLLAFQQTSGPSRSTWVGLENFGDLLHDELFWLALRNTAAYAAGCIAIGLPLSLALAMMLNGRGVRARAFWRLVFFSPSLVGLVFAGLMFTFMFEKNTGLVNMALHAATLGWFPRDFAWLEVGVMKAMLIAALWLYTGFNMVYFLAALQAVSPELCDAARIDGAGPLRHFVHVTLPAIRPVGAFVVLLSLIGSFQLFELPWILLNGSGGPGNRGLTVVMYLYQRGFEGGDLGYASAVGWGMALVLLAAAVVLRPALRAGEA